MEPPNLIQVCVLLLLCDKYRNHPVIIIYKFGSYSALLYAETSKCDLLGVTYAYIFISPAYQKHYTGGTATPKQCLPDFQLFTFSGHFKAVQTPSI